MEGEAIDAGSYHCKVTWLLAFCGSKTLGLHYSSSLILIRLTIAYLWTSLVPFSGYGVRGGSASPLRHRKFDRHYSSDFDHPARSQRGRGFRGGRGRGRFRDSSPSYGRGRNGGRSYTRSFDEPGFGHPPSRGEGMNRNNPNVSPREGDWICPDPTCGNLNFARRDYCNNCNRLRFGPGGSPRRYSPGPVPPRFSGPPANRSPARGMNGYRSPPRDSGRDRPRVFGADPPHLRRGGRFPDHQMRRARPDIREDEDYRARDKFDGPLRPEWGPRDRGRGMFHERRGFEGRNDRHLPSPPPPPPPPLPSHRGRWGRDLRVRSRSPVRVGPPPRDFRRDAYMDRGPEGRRGMARDRMGELY
ncbi:RNA-binding protein EWS-like isoform X2 [Macadamia integrifolia]|uniref:RNA-binding protein EWS-like isoform X2 n=1 Tax=Macadamia integrifolia TaxID=60698 RepID=UPI001C4FCD05|nr:RNA-binding protein EWS-like isoform X2 [Macadamia integrifolia]